MLHRLEGLVARTGTGVAPRLSISPTGRIGGPPRISREIIALLGRARVSSHVEGMWTLALADLMWDDPAGEGSARAIRQLQAAAETGPTSASLLADLAAAYLVRAEHGGSFLHLQYAVEAAGRALELEPAHAAARYNLALALDRMMLDAEAGDAWRSAAAIDPRSEWGRQAARRMQQLTTTPVPWKNSHQPLAKSASRFPQEARLFAMDTLLARWGQAVLHGDSATAEAHLRDAQTIGSALATRGGDHSVADMVAAIHRHGSDGGAKERLARAHVLYARAQERIGVRHGAEALARLDSMASVGGNSPVLALWMDLSRGVSLFYTSRGSEAAALLPVLAARVDRMRYPALAGRVWWSIGTTELRAARYPAARDWFVVAATLFARAGEREHLGSVQQMQGEALFGLGDEDAAYARMSDALRNLRPYRGSQWLHNALYNLSQAATVRGMNRVSIRLQEEDVAVAMAVPARPGVRAEALLARARSLAGAGALARARRDVDRATTLLDSIESPREREWQVVQLRFALAVLWVRTTPERAVAMLDSVLPYYQREVRSRAVSSLAYRAEAQLLLGQFSAATADLDSAAMLIDSVTSRVRDAGERAMALANGRRVFEQLVMLHAREGRTIPALASLERARVAFGERGGRNAASPALAAPPGQTVMDYVLVGDTLLTFVIHGRNVLLHRQMLDGAELAATIARARTLLERHAPPGALHPPLELLYARLIHPVRHLLPSGTPLVLVADGILGEVPFPALRDGVGGRYLLQDHVVRSAGSLADAVRSGPAEADAGGTAVFVADPAFSRAAHPGLPRLPQTGLEARRIARFYPGATVLEGSLAGRERVREALAGARVFHFAGHAIFDPDRASQSHLVVAPESGGPGRIGPADLSAMDLQGVRLVVLAACETQRSATGRSGGLPGLSEAFLAAGVGGVVGSLWKVREEPTRVLMEEFHRAYRASGNAAAALSTAQLRMLASPDPALRSPAAWAGFRYSGISGARHLPLELPHRADAGFSPDVSSRQR